MDRKENTNTRERMTVQEAGRKGGEARAEKYSAKELSEQAKRGAQTIERKHPGFHSQIGEKGGRNSHAGLSQNRNKNQ